MANEIKKINVDGIEYELGGGGAGQELISQDDITFIETITENDEYYVEIADEDINGKYVNIVVDEVLTELENGWDTIYFQFNNPKNATLSFICTSDNAYIESIIFRFNTFLKGFTCYQNAPVDWYCNFTDSESNCLGINLAGEACIITLTFDAFGYLTIQHIYQGEV